MSRLASGVHVQIFLSEALLLLDSRSRFHQPAITLFREVENLRRLVTCLVAYAHECRIAPLMDSQITPDEFLERCQPLVF